VLTLGYAASVAVAAFLGGVVGAMLGLGGGILIVPAFTLVLGMPIHVAVATSLVAVVATSSVASTLNLRLRFSNARLALVLATVTAAGSLVGGLLGTSMTTVWITGAFGILLAVVGVLMLVKREADVVPGRAPGAGAGDGTAAARGDAQRGGFGWALDGSYFDPASDSQVSYRPRSIGKGLVFSFLAGNLSGMLGIGGGVVQVPVMNLLLGLPMKAATSTSSHIISLTAMAGAVVYLIRGFVNPLVAAVAVIGVFLGARTGARLAQVLPGAFLRKVFSVVLFYGALRMLARAFDLPLPL